MNKIRKKSRKLGIQEKKKNWVQLYWTGCQPVPIHGRDPTTAEHGDFCLLCHHPGPVRPSLDNLVSLGSPELTILMPCLVRTPDRHRSPESRTPALKPSTNPDLQVAGLQEHATTPSR